MLTCKDIKKEFPELVAWKGTNIVTGKKIKSLEPCCCDCHDSWKEDCNYHGSFPPKLGQLNNGWRISVCCAIASFLAYNDYATFDDPSSINKEVF